MLIEEGKITEQPFTLDELKGIIYPASGVKRLLEETLMPALTSKLKTPELLPSVFNLIQDALELYGLHAHVALRIGLKASGLPTSSLGAVLNAIQSSREGDILATLLLARLSRGDTNVNLFHRLRSMRRHLEAVENIINLANQERRLRKELQGRQRNMRNTRF